MFIPTTIQEIKALRWDQPDIILVSGDAYIDTPPYRGCRYRQIPVCGMGSRQPSSDNRQPLMVKILFRLGEPKAFLGSHQRLYRLDGGKLYFKQKWRKQDDYTPGGVNVRPDRATILYAEPSSAITVKNKKPIVLGGFEASLRRVAHYDYWDNTIRRSILFDAKADILTYGMSENAVLEIANALKNGTEWRKIKGICYISNAPVPAYSVLPSFEAVKADKTGIFSHVQAILAKYGQSWHRICPTAWGSVPDL